MIFPAYCWVGFGWIHNGEVHPDRPRRLDNAYPSGTVATFSCNAGYFPPTGRAEICNDGNFKNRVGPKGHPYCQKALGKKMNILFSFCQ